MNVIVVATYAVYVIISVLLTIWVAKTLHKNGRIFVVDAFRGDESRGDAVNHLLVVGFYLINMGFILMFLSLGKAPQELVEAIEYVTTKLGIVMLVLGGMHFFNVFNFDKMRRKAKLSTVNKVHKDE